jgi:TPR repeat protein
MSTDPEGAVDSLRELSRGGYAMASFNIAVAYARGVLGKADLDEAFSWYKVAASQGSLSARLRIGIMLYRKGQVREGFENIESAVVAGHAPAMRRLGRVYFRGEGVACDRVEAAKWWRRAIQAGNLAAKLEYGQALMSGAFGLLAIFTGAILFVSGLFETVFAVLFARNVQEMNSVRLR